MVNKTKQVLKNTCFFCISHDKLLLYYLINIVPFWAEDNLNIEEDFQQIYSQNQEGDYLKSNDANKEWESYLMI